MVSVGSCWEASPPNESVSSITPSPLCVPRQPAQEIVVNRTLDNCVIGLTRPTTASRVTMNEGDRSPSTLHVEHDEGAQGLIRGCQQKGGPEIDASLMDLLRIVHRHFHALVATL